MANEKRRRPAPHEIQASWIKANRVAAEMDCSVRTVKRWIEEGKIEAVRLTPQGEWRINRASLERWVETLRSRCSPRTTGPVDGETWPDVTEPAAGS
jgi:excisionase family DNA binding protein